MQEIPSNLPNTINYNNDQDGKNEDSIKGPSVSTHRLNYSEEKTIVNKNYTDKEMTKSDCVIKSYNTREFDTNITNHCDRKCFCDNEGKNVGSVQYSTKCNCSNAAQDLTSHNCTGYELNFKTKKSPNKR